MKSRFILPSAMVITLLAGSCAGDSDTLGVSESMLRFLPEETVGVVFVDLSGLRESSVARRFIEEQAGVQVPDQLEEFESATGFDIGTDLRQIMAGSSGEGSGLIVLAAVYDRAVVTGYLSGQGFSSGEHAGVEVFRPNPSEDAVLAFVDDFVLMGPEAGVVGAIDRSRGGTSSALENAALLADIQSVDEEGYQIWATGRIDAAMLPDGTDSVPLQLIGGLERGTYQMRVDENLTARAIGEFRSADEAVTVSSFLEGLRGMAMLQEMPAAMAEVLSGIRIASSDRRVEIQLAVETAVLERLAESGALTR